MALEARLGADHLELGHGARAADLDREVDAHRVVPGALRRARAGHDRVENELRRAVLDDAADARDPHPEVLAALRLVEGQAHAHARGPLVHGSGEALPAAVLRRPVRALAIAQRPDLGPARGALLEIGHRRLEGGGHVARGGGHLVHAQRDEVVGAFHALRLPGPHSVDHHELRGAGDLQGAPQSPDPCRELRLRRALDVLRHARRAVDDDDDGVHGLAAHAADPASGDRPPHAEQQPEHREGAHGQQEDLAQPLAPAGQLRAVQQEHHRAPLDDLVPPLVHEVDDDGDRDERESP